MENIEEDEQEMKKKTEGEITMKSEMIHVQIFKKFHWRMGCQFIPLLAEKLKSK